ncbi:MAG: hypothetical protein FJW23_03580 [Acidimicrobiia bacterium]|nr:hypothetical protein [Acidimicrobiia bacterium]
MIARVGAPWLMYSGAVDERAASAAGEPLAPDPVIEAFKKDVDRTLIRENLKLTPEERIRKLQSVVAFLEEVRRAGRSRR